MQLNKMTLLFAVTGVALIFSGNGVRSTCQTDQLSSGPALPNSSNATALINSTQADMDQIRGEIEKSRNEVARLQQELESAKQELESTKQKLKEAAGDVYYSWHCGGFIKWMFNDCGFALNGEVGEEGELADANNLIIKSFLEKADDIAKTQSTSHSQAEALNAEWVPGVNTAIAATGYSLNAYVKTTLVYVSGYGQHGSHPQPRTSLRIALIALKK